MATSSIFENVRIDTPNKAEAFASALAEAAEDSRSRVKATPRRETVTDQKEIRKLFERDREARKKVL